MQNKAIQTSVHFHYMEIIHIRSSLEGHPSNHFSLASQSSSLLPEKTIHVSQSYLNLMCSQKF
jgi:hypothetical protein